jgi:HPt (histidine-containing phosphotransfer) domain-containing protein
MDDFLTKPVDPGALAGALAQRLRTAAPRAPDHPPSTGSSGTRDDRDEGDLDVSRLDMLRDMGPGSTSYLDRAIGNFVANSPGQLTTIREAIAAGDVDGLQHAAHRLAGSAGNLGVVPVSEAARRLEHLADGGSTDDAAGIIPELLEALERGRAALLAYQATYTGPAA